MKFLGAQFGGRLIIRNAKSGDLLTLRTHPQLTFVLGAGKAKVYHNFVPTTLRALEDRIRSVIVQFMSDEVSAALTNLSSRKQMCLDSCGERFEHHF